VWNGVAVSKAIISSDWHLDWITAGFPRYDEIDAAIDQSVDCAIKMPGASPLYLFGGDLTDPDNLRCHAALAKAVQVAQRLNDGGVSSLWITGNHDVIEDGSGHHTLMALQHIPGVTVADSPELYGDVFCLPFTPTSHSYDPDDIVRLAHARGDDPKVVLGHLNVEGIVPGSETTQMPRGRDVFWPLDALKECWPNATLIGGHYHERQNYKGINIIGSLARLAFGEEDNDPAFAVVEF
jgi:DNA repair exonuclease SbcCD nuclease subunit